MFNGPQALGWPERNSASCNSAALLRTKTVQRRGLMVLSQAIRATAPLPSHRVQQHHVQDKCKSARCCSHSFVTHTAPLPLPVHSRGPLTPTFPDVFSWLMEHSWTHKAPPRASLGGFADNYPNGGKRLPLVCVTFTFSQKDEHSQRSQRLHVTSETTRPSHGLI